MTLIEDPVERLGRDRRSLIDGKRNFRAGDGASWAINFCATAALIVCIVITTLFLEEFFQANLTTLAGGLFICAMVALICGLASFLREVYLATRSIRIPAPICN